MSVLRVLLLLTVVALPALADEDEIAGDALATLLTGNSIEGTWNGKAYDQYFDPGGRTGYRSAGGAVDWGTWRIAGDGRYCSVWRGGGEACYAVVERDGTFYWRAEGSEALQPFTVIEGNVLQP